MTYRYRQEPTFPNNTMSTSSAIADSLDSVVPSSGVNFIRDDELPEDVVVLSSDLYVLLTSIAETAPV